MQIQKKPELKLRKQLFISSSKTKNIKEDYQYIRQLGAGGYGVVFLAVHRITKQRRAIKTIAKENVQDKETFANEIKLLKKIDHPHIIKLYQVYQTEKTVYLVTEQCEGGELFYLIVEKKFLTQAQTAIIMRQLFSAIAYLHEHNVCHRDLKPQNILLKNKQNITSIKIIDFGIAKIFKENEIQNQPKGTTMYLAPEIISGKYGKQIDNWACGVILYILLCGRPPFYGKDIPSILQSIRKGIYTLDREPFYACSNQVKDLLSKLLVRDPRMRYTALKAYEHPWIKNTISKNSPEVNFSEQVFRGLKKLVTMKGLKRTILMYLALQIPQAEVQNLRNIFIKLDKNGNGMISKEQMIQGLEYIQQKIGAKISIKDIDQIFTAMDFDCSGQIDYSEFLASFLDCHIYKNEKFLKKSFETMDSDKDGKLSKTDLQKIIHSDTLSFGSLDLQKLIDEADLDGDGKIDYNEFMVLLRQKTRTIIMVQ